MIRAYFSGIAVSCCFLLLCSCGDDKQKDQSTHFTKVDTVTETYLELKEKMVESWNRMMHDDNQKLKAMRHIIHELKVSNPEEREDLKHYGERLENLANLRYTQKTMENTNVVEEYDFASNALVAELISMAEAEPEFAYNTTLQRLVETIRTSDQRVQSYREEYDRVASQYNKFMEEHKVAIREIEADSFVDKKPLFQMVAEE